MTRRTPGQAHARRVLCALARTALDVCDLRAEAGLEDDDRPRMWLAALERWTRDEATGAALGAATREMDVHPAHRKAGTRPNGAALPGPWPDEAWRRVMRDLRDAREDLARHPSHLWHDGRVLSALTQSLASTHGAGVTPETVHDAAGRVERVYRQHLGDVELAAEALAAARLAQAREDRAEAEPVLGTVRP